MSGTLELADKRILVTGASSGIGRAIAQELARAGASLVVCGRREPELQQTLLSLASPERHRMALFDLRETDAIQPWCKSLVAQAGEPFDGLVHAAGVGGIVPLRMVKKAQIDEVFGLNVAASAAILGAVGAKGIVSEQASVVMISSAAALTAPAGMGLYAASKAAMNALVRSAAKEFGKRGIRVNAVAPGYVETPMLEASQNALPGDALKKTLEQQFLGILSPAEVAAAVRYLLSDASRRLTGQTLVIDGGYTC